MNHLPLQYEYTVREISEYDQAVAEFADLVARADQVAAKNTS